MVESDFVGGWTLKHPRSTRRNRYEHLDPDLILAAASHTPYWKVRPEIGNDLLAAAELATARVVPIREYGGHTRIHTLEEPLVRKA